MKRLLILLSAIALLIPVRISAQEDFHMAAGATLGVMEGAGVSLAFGVIDNLNVRAGFSGVPSFLIPKIAMELPKWNSNPATSAVFSGSLSPTGNILVDYHPGGHSFRITAGVFIGSNDFAKAFNTESLPDSYRNAGITYYVDGDKEDLTKLYRILSDEKGILHGSLKAIPARPFIGIGFGSAIPKGRVGAAVDLGLEYTGGLKACADARNIKGEQEDLYLTTHDILETIYGMRGDRTARSYDKYFNYVDKLAALPVLPVLRCSVFVKLF